MPVFMRDDLSIEYLNSILRLDAEAGVLYWRVPRSRQKAGAIAGRPSPRGYINIGIDDATYRAHRIVFALFYGRWPIGEVDHINRVKHDNRIENLRECTKKENGLNKDVYRNNTSGIAGVGWDKARKCWKASINRDGKKVSLGRFRTKEEAAARVNGARSK
jgi:hypothetical protein